MSFSYDFSKPLKPTFCKSCGRAYCFGSGPPKGLACPCCRTCFRGKCKKNNNNSTKRVGKEKSAEVKQSNKKQKLASSDKEISVASGGHKTGDILKQKAASAHSNDSIPLAKQSEVRVLQVSSEENPHIAENSLGNDDGKTCWKSEHMPTKKSQKEQCVEFQLDGSEDRGMRRVKSVSVLTHQSVGGITSELRIDYSVDGKKWVRGSSLWGLCSMGYRPNPMLGIEARFVRIVCEKKSYRLQEQVGYAHVQFN